MRGGLLMVDRFVWVAGSVLINQLQTKGNAMFPPSGVGRAMDVVK